MHSINSIVVHGAFGYPSENWFSWLQKKLEISGVSCYVPRLSTPENQNLENWYSEFNDQVGCMINSNTILIGHSLGAAFVLKWLEKYRQPILSVILVGAFLGAVNNKKFDSINKSFFSEPIDFNKINSKYDRFICYYGTGDPYIERNHFDMIAAKLKAKKVIVSKACHFNKASGYTRFPLLLHVILQMKAL